MATNHFNPKGAPHALKFDQEYYPDIRRKQNLCAALFILLHITSYVSQICIFAGVNTSFQTWVLPIAGMIAISAFVMLYNLSSNMSCDIFSASQIGFEAFFSIVLPFMLNRPNSDPDYSDTIFYICMAFCLLAVYFWSVMLNNNAFSVSDKFWISILLVPYLMNFCNYLCVVNYTPLFFSVLNPGVKSPVMLITVLTLFYAALCMGSWRLAHSAPFSGNKDMTTRTSLSPFNIYMITFVAALALVILIIEPTAAQ